MRWAVVAAALTAVGCNVEGSDEPAGAATLEGATITRTYPYTGHPLAVETNDPSVLARETELEALTNMHRVSMGLPALIPRDDVRAVARAHSEHMIVHSFFAHESPERYQPWDRARVAKEEYGENIAGGFATAAEAFQAFLDSTGHRRNIENPDWVAHGDGYAYSARSTYLHYWTQNFVTGGASTLSPVGRGGGGR